MFTNRDIADYYNQTQQHYQRWWNLDKALAVHYGLWYPETKSFIEALKNTNRELLDLAEIGKGARVLDAGCGVGGSSFFLATARNAKVTGITLSERQLAYAQEQACDLAFENQVDFKNEDYTQTSFPDQTFDLIWAIESLTSAQDKQKFAAEAFRILKPGGVLVLADYFRVEQKADPKQWMEKWRRTWSLAPILSELVFIEAIETGGLVFDKSTDYTKQITPTARRMYWASLAGALPSIVYNTLHNTSRFAKTHYKSGIYQYNALRNGLWQYQMLRFVKPLN